MPLSSQESPEPLTTLLAGAWFAGLPRGLQLEIVEAGTEVSYRRDEIITRQGATSTGLYAVLDGLVAIGRWLDADDYVLIHVGQPALWFGEVPTICGLPAPVETRARTGVRLLHLRPEGVDRFCEQDPERFRLFARLAFERYALFVRLTARLQHRSPEMQLRQRLIEIAGLHDVEHTNGGGFEWAISQADLADIVGLSRQTVNRLLRRLERDGLVELSFKRIRVIDPSRLDVG